MLEFTEISMLLMVKMMNVTTSDCLVPNLANAIVQNWIKEFQILYIDGNASKPQVMIFHKNEIFTEICF